MEKAIIYARTSREDAHKQGLSIEEQIRRGKEVAKREKLEVVGVYKDESKTSVKLPRQFAPPDASPRRSWREDFSKALADLQSKKASYLIVRDIDRTARKMEDNIRVLKFVEACGAEIILTDSSLPDLTSANGKLALNMTLSVMQYHYDRSVEYGRQTHQRKTSQGQKFGPAGKQFGYADGFDNLGRPVQNQITVVEDEAKTVREIFRRFVVEREGVLSICRWLDSQNFDIAIRPENKTRLKDGKISRRTKPIPIQTVLRLLKNPKYCGKAWYEQKDKKGKVVKRTLVDSVWPKIIEPDIWDDAQDKLKPKTVRDWGKHTVTPMSGLAHCSSCGSPLICHSDKARDGKPTERRYLCINRACKAPAVPMLLTEWERFLKMVCGFHAVFNAKQPQTPSGLTPDEKQRMRQLEMNLEGLSKKITSGRFEDGETFESVENERSLIRRNLVQLRQKAEVKTYSSPKIDWEKMSAIQKNDALKHIISALKVGRERVEIQFAGLNLWFHFPILQIWGTHKYRFSLLPSPYLIKGRGDGDLLGGIWDMLKLDRNVLKVGDISWNGYDWPLLINGISVHRNLEDAPLSHHEVLLSMRDKVGRREWWEKNKIAKAEKPLVHLKMYSSVPDKQKPSKTV